ncbi:DNA ligase [Burkholderia stagnalis]|uniref:DNA ligase D n=1 Tax=Burkholderia stagnalis TaxID=1503054 RepID=UPI00075FDF2E|nr:DNA ligase D [Burkholderia stagnalis]KWK24719.1 DNA ligase [Burkholderia stagnalis]
MPSKLDPYRRKRRFDATPEPNPKRKAQPKPDGARTRRGAAPLRYVIQEHHARRLHYDFRLELDGTLKSWAVPKGPSVDPSVKRLAVHVEDHPLDYAEFEGEIPKGHYGAGSVTVWDAGVWEPDGGVAQARKGYRAGKLTFRLDGEKLHGGWALVRSGRQDARQEQWLLVKERDDDARSADDYDVVAAQPGSVLHAHARATPRATRRAPPASNGARRARRASGASRASGVSRVSRVSDVEGAKRAALPERLAPQLATLVDAPPQHGDWRYEMKFDGYRILARIDGTGAHRRVKLTTREGHDWTAKFPAQRDALAQLDVADAWLDGEAVVLRPNGVPDFQRLQNALGTGHANAVTLFLFDLPFLDGHDLRDAPLVARRGLLEPLLADSDPALLRYSPDLGERGPVLLASACEVGLEGLIAKRANAPYRAGRSAAWIKLKCRRRQEFVIGGFTEPAGSRHGFGALLLGVHEPVPGNGATLRYVGRVGTGFDTRMLDRLSARLHACERATMPFATPPRERARTRVHWVQPTLVAECEFAEWTGDGIVRQAAFVALREDKPARQVVMERPRPADEATKPDGGRGNGHAHARGDGARKGNGKAKAKTKTKSDGKANAKSKANGKNKANGKVRGKANGDAGHASASASTSAPALASTTHVRITHPDRVLDPASGTRKIDLVRYWEWVAPWLLPDLKGRPVSLVRVPGEIGGEQFFQRHAEQREIPFVTRHAGLDPGHGPLLTIDSVDALVGAAQMGALELHTWNAHASNIEHPDRIVFDLDPDPALPWRAMIEAAQLMHGLLEALGLASFCKTSGGKGLHVVVPITRHAGWDDVKDFAKAVAQHAAAALPDRFTAKMGPRNRRGKIFVDYLRNGRGASTIAAYSARARPGIGVSVPIGWDEVPHTTGGAQWTIDTLRARLERLARDPWDGYGDVRQRVSAQMRARLASS